MIGCDDSTPRSQRPCAKRVPGRWRGAAAILTALAAGPGGAGPAAAQAMPPAEHFFKAAAIHDVKLSPSGKRLALSRPAPDGRVGVFVVDLQGQDFKATRAIHFSDGDVPSFSWVDDERLVFTVTDLQAGLGEAYRHAPGLYAVRHDGEEFTVLVETRGRSLVTGGDRGRALPWNHRLLHVPVPSEGRSGARANEVVIGRLQFSGNDLVGVHPLWLDTRSGRTRDLAVGPLSCAATGWWFSAQGEPRAARCVDKGRESLHWYKASGDGQGGSWSRIAEGPLHALGMRPLWVGQGDTMFVEHKGGPAGERVVAPFDFSRNAPGETRVNAPGFDFDGTLIGDREGRRLLGVRLDTDAESTVWFDSRHDAMQQRADAALPGRVNRIECRRCGSDDAVALVRSFSDREPGELLLFRQADDQGKGRWMRVGSVRPEIRAERMAPTDFHRLKARDGRDLPVWITRPAAAAGAVPAVVLVHGGPWVRGRYWRWEAMPQFLASRGWLVIEPEFRGSDGYGQAHLRAGFRQWGQAMQDDVADALLWARREGLATADAACIVGGSYGGYSTLMGLIRHPELYRCGSAWVAVTDPFLYLQGSWWVDDDIGDLGRRHSLPQMVGDAERDRDMLRAHSPVAQAARLRRPLQLMWGGEDRRVPIAHGNRLRDALRQAGQSPEWIVYDEEGHGLRRTENQVDFARKLEAFLARHLRDAAAGTR